MRRTNLFIALLVFLIVIHGASSSSLCAARVNLHPLYPRFRYWKRVVCFILREPRSPDCRGTAGVGCVRMAGASTPGVFDPEKL
jgi:hypothetical protein